MTAHPGFSLKFDFGGRDFACLAFALAVHSLLLLWKGGLLTLPEAPGSQLGDMLVNVNFRADVPTYEAPGGGGVKKGFFERVKSIMKREEGAGAKKSDLAPGPEMKSIEAEKPTWTKTDVLVNKAFTDKKGFQGATQKDALSVATGETKNVAMSPSVGEFKKAEPNLKESAFKLAKKDMPFKIASQQSTQELVNVNAIMVNVGSETTPKVNSLDGGPGAGPALQSKALAPRGSTGSGGFAGMNSSAGQSSGGGLATGGVVGSAGPASGGFSAGIGSGSGSGGGSGSGNGSGRGTGVGSGNGGGRAWGGGTGFGSGTGTMQTLPRNAVSDSPAAGKSANDTGFNITGALRNRPILQKSWAAYEMDCHVAVRFRVNFQGFVMDGALIEVSSGSPTFDQKVINALKQWRFSQLPADRSNEVQEGVVTFVFKGV